MEIASAVIGSAIRIMRERFEHATKTADAKIIAKNPAIAALL